MIGCNVCKGVLQETQLFVLGHLLPERIYTCSLCRGGGSTARLGGRELTFYVALTSIHCYRKETIVDS